MTKETSEKLKDFRKTCKKQQSSFWDTQNNEFRDSENDTFWKILKKCDENIASNKNPKAVDGENGRNITQTFFSDINKRNQTTPQKQSKRKYQKVILPF